MEYIVGVKDSAHQLDQVGLPEVEQSRATASLWIVGGLAALVGVVVLGGSVVSVLAFEDWDSLGAVALGSVSAGIYGLLVVVPLAVGPAISLMVGVPLTTHLYIRRAYPVRVLTVAGAIGVIAAACCWYLGSVVTPMVSMWIGDWVYGLDPGTFDHYFVGFLPTSTPVWSLVESVVFGLAVLIVHAAAGIRGGPASGRARIRQAFIGVAALTVVCGILFALNAMRTYDGLGISVQGN